MKKQWGKNFNLKCKTFFTLTELLIVIAIITILSGILLPTLTQTRNIAKQITCINNQKQMIMGALMYSDNYKGYLLPGYLDLTLTFSWFHWIMTDINPTIPRLYPSNQDFRRTYPIFICPAETKPIHYFQYTHYGVNAYLVHRRKPANKMSNIKKAAAAIFYSDSAAEGSYIVVDDRLNKSYSASFRHLGTNTVTAYADGHVATRKPNLIQYWRPYNNATIFSGECTNSNSCPMCRQ